MPYPNAFVILSKRICSTHFIIFLWFKRDFPIEEICWKSISYIKKNMCELQWKTVVCQMWFCIGNAFVFCPRFVQMTLEMCVNDCWQMRGVILHRTINNLGLCHIIICLNIVWNALCNVMVVNIKILFLSSYSHRLPVGFIYCFDSTCWFFCHKNKIYFQ